MKNAAILLRLKTTIYVHIPNTGIVIAKAEMLNKELLTLQIDYRGSASFTDWKVQFLAIRTAQNESGVKKMLTNVRSLIFCPSSLDARLSITVLALKSCNS